VVTSPPLPQPKKLVRDLATPGRMQGWVELGTAVSVQPVPKATYRSGRHDKHNRGGRDEQILYTHHGNQENGFSANDVIPYILHKPEWQTIF